MPPIDTTLVASLLGPHGPSFESVLETDSTNRQLLDRTFDGEAAAPRLLVAERQTAGRGRRGRSWVAEPGRSVCLSLAIEREVGTPLRPGLPLAIGCALACALEPVSNGLALKWPNDLLRHGRKCAGILIESKRGGAPALGIERCVIGVGLNLAAPRDESGLIGQPAGGLFDDLLAAPRIESVIARVAQALIEAAALHGHQGLAPFLADWSRLDAWHGRAVSVSDAGQLVAQGIAQGIDESGALRLHTAAGPRSIVAGDVSLRLQ